MQPLNEKTRTETTNNLATRKIADLFLLFNCISLHTLHLNLRGFTWIIFGVADDPSSLAKIRRECAGSTRSLALIQQPPVTFTKVTR